MLLRFLIGLSAMLLLSACISPKSYVDPKYATLDYSDVTVAARDISLTTTFTRQGKPIKRAQKLLQTNVEEILTKAGYRIVEDGADMALQMSFNNVPEEGAFGKGFGTGLTLGLAGTAVSDFYEVTIVQTQADQTSTREYGHAIHTTIGNKSAPVANVAASANLNDAFYEMVEDVVLQFLIDMDASADIANDAVAFLPIRLRSGG